MEIGGLPLHPLVVHAAVVLTPLAALTAVLYALVARWREWLRWPMLGLALVATGAVVGAYLSDDSFLASRPELSQNPLVRTHEERAELLLWLTLGLGAVAALTGGLRGRTTGGLHVGLRVLLALTRVTVVVQVVLTGDAGSRAVWGTSAA